MKEQPELSVEEVPTDELIPYARNAKIHTNEQVDQICSSIEEFGFNDPVAVWDGPEGTEIVAGHGRVMAAKKLGMTKVPIIRLDHMDDKERKAYGLAHNKTTMNTGWDFAKLDAELDELAGEFDMGDFGFDSMPEFDAIEDLMQNDFTDSTPKEDAETFNVTFVFPVEAREAVTEYLKGYGKDNVAQRIVEEAEQWA